MNQPALSINHYTGDHFTTRTLAKGETIRAVVNGVEVEIAYHQHPYSADGVETPSLSVRVL